MNRILLIASVILIAILSACGQVPEAIVEPVELKTLDGRPQPVLFDDIELARAFEDIGSEVELLEPEAFAKAAHTFSGGFVGYTPIPDEIKPIPWWPIPLPEWWPPICDPRLCDPIKFRIGWRFDGILVTESFVNKVKKLGLNTKSIASLDFKTVQSLVTDYGFDIGSVGLVLPDDFDSPCFERNPPRWCWLADDLLDNPFDADIIIVDSRDLLDVHDKLGRLILLHGEGLEPTIRTLSAASVKISEKEAQQFGEFVSSADVQAHLFETAGVIPAHVAVRDKVLDKSMRSHVETAMKYGSKN